MQQHVRKYLVLGLAMGFASFAFAEEASDSKELSMSTPRGDPPAPGDCTSKTPDPNCRTNSDDADYDVYTLGTGDESDRTAPCNRKENYPKKCK